MPQIVHMTLILFFGARVQSSQCYKYRVAILCMQMRTIPEPKRFEYPCSTKSFPLGACMPTFIHITETVLCKSLGNVDYYNTWVHNELCKWENSGSWNTSSVFQGESMVIWNNTCVIMLIMQNTIEVIRLCQNRLEILKYSHFVYANEDNAGSESFCLPFYYKAFSMESMCTKFCVSHNYSLGARR